MNTKIWNLVAAFSLIGIFLVGYLLKQYYIPDASGVCCLNNRFTCTTITTTELGYLFGVPIAAIGLVGYLVILLSSIIKNKFLAIGMSLFGFFFCLRVTILELFFVDVICPVCIACQVNMAILVVLSILFIVNWKSSKKDKEK